MKAVMLAAQNIQTGQRDLMVAGGMESMSMAPSVFFFVFQNCNSDRRRRFYFPRVPGTFGHATAEDAIVKDGLTDVYNNFAMGNWSVVALTTVQYPRISLITLLQWRGDRSQVRDHS